MTKVILTLLSMIHMSVFAQLEVTDSLIIGKRISSFSISKDQKHIATAFARKGNQLFIFDNLTKKIIKEIPFHKEAISRIQYSSDGKHIATGMWDGTTYVLDAKTYEILNIFEKHKKVVTDICFYKTDKIATLSKDGKIITWNIKTGKQISEFDTEANRLSHLTYNAESNIFIVKANFQKNRNSVLYFLNENLSIFKEKDYKFSGSSKYLPKLKSVFITNDDNFTLHKVDSNGEILGNYNRHKHWIYDYVSLNNGEFIVSCSADKTVKIYKGDKELGVLKFSDQIVKIEVLGENLFACYSIDGKIKIIKNNY